MAGVGDGVLRGLDLGVMGCGVGEEKESHWVMRHWVGVKSGCFGFVWVQILVWVG